MAVNVLNRSDKAVADWHQSSVIWSGCLKLCDLYVNSHVPAENMTVILQNLNIALFPLLLHNHSGCVFYSPLSGFSLLAYEVT